MVLAGFSAGSAVRCLPEDSLSCQVWIAIRPSVLGYQWAEVFGMGKPGATNFLRDLILLQGFLQDLQPAHKLPTHDGVFGMGLLQRLSLVFHIRPKKLRGELKLHFLDSVLVRSTKEKPYHPVGKDPVNKYIDNFPQLGLSANFVVGICIFPN
jgi:hypothetical protein